VTRSQYIASSAAGYDVSALDAVFEEAIRHAREAGRRYFDFGTSNRSGGRELSASLYEFKQEFGGGGVVHEQYDLELTA
jgi:lipid II:glycine glycyltransferase (peptidoglycan interpeptide bridge formation enzyme)